MCGALSVSSADTFRLAVGFFFQVLWFAHPPSPFSLQAKIHLPALSKKNWKKIDVITEE